MVGSFQPLASWMACVEGSAVEADRIEVRFTGAKEGVVRLVAAGPVADERTFPTAGVAPALGVSGRRRQGLTYVEHRIASFIRRMVRADAVREGRHACAA